jgi:glutamate/tyrosine decarboxylase-like PLP-dependent enzyme
VDAAWAGVFALLPEHRQLFFQGLQGVDSFDTNPHKGLLVGWEW